MKIATIEGQKNEKTIGQTKAPHESAPGRISKKRQSGVRFFTGILMIPNKYR